MRIKCHALLADLSERTRKMIREAQSLRKYSLEVLGHHEAAQKWSVMECIAHLNRYGNFYLPEIGKQIRTSGYAPEEVFKSGFLGNFFAESMLPKENLMKIRSFREKDPMGSRLDKEEIKVFLEQQHELLDLLNAAAEVSLSRTKTRVSISRWIHLRLGDTLRVIIYHNQRHMVQAQKALDAAGLSM